MAKKIMVVDDEPFIIEMLQVTLTDAGFEVVVATEGTEVFPKVLAEKPDLISLDVNMPGKHGFEICRELKADPATKHIPVIFLSASTQADDVNKGIALGAEKYMTKPVPLAEYEAVIKGILKMS